MSISPAALAQLEAAEASVVSAQQTLAAVIAGLTPPVGIPVGPGDNFLSLLASSPAGSTFLLDPLCVFAVPQLVIAKPCTIQSALDPGPTRVSSALVGPILRGDVTVPAAGVTFSGIRLEGVDPNQTLLTTGPQTIVDRCLVLGSAQGQHRGICVNSAGVTIRQSAIQNIWASIDAQAIAGWSGTADLVVDDCALEASGENVIFGGADTASADLNPIRITLHNCDITKPAAWHGLTDRTIKNLIEIKNASFVTVSGCRCAYTWVNGQVGYALVLTVRNQDGGSPWSNVTDILIEDSTFAHSAGGINILGSDDTNPSGQMTRVTIARCQFTDINQAVFGWNGRQVMIGGGPQQLTLDACTFSGVGENSFLTFTNALAKNPTASPTLGGFVVRGVTADEGDYGIQGDGAPGLGVPALSMYAPSAMWSGVTIHRGTSGRTIAYPPGTTLV